MSDSTKIPERLNRVQTIFREVAAMRVEPDYNELNRKFVKEYDDFVSLAFEATAYRLTLDHLDTDPDHVQNFIRQFGDKHNVQILAGIGAALSKLNRPISDMSKIVEPTDMIWIANGYGFFSGMFKKGDTVEAQKRPIHITGFQGDFDKGLGRSFWYSSGGYILIVANTIEGFSPARHADLWTGIGTAFTYVGGFGQGDIEQLQSVSGSHFRSVREGIESALRSKRKAGTSNEYTKLICKELPGCEEKSQLA